MRATRLAAAAVLATSLAPEAGHAIVVLNQIDTFESGTTEGWFAGGGPTGQVPPVPPQNVATGGPAGAGDNYLLISANGGTGPGSRLVAINGAQWAGNYTGASVLRISMDLNNLGQSDLSIRLYFEDPAVGPPLDTAITTAVATLPAGSGWTHVTFDINAASLTTLQGNATTLLTGTTLLRIVNVPDISLGTELFALVPSVIGLLGVDNIATGDAVPDTTAAPEPATLALFGSGLLGLAAARRRKTK